MSRNTSAGIHWFFCKRYRKVIVTSLNFFVNLTSAFCSSLCAASMYRHPSASEGT